MSIPIGLGRIVTSLLTLAILAPAYALAAAPASTPPVAPAPLPAPTSLPTTVPTATEPAAGHYIWVALLAVAILVIWRTRAYRPSTIAGPQRLAPTESPRPYVIALGIALLGWILVPALYGSLAMDPARSTTVPINEALTPRELVTLNAVAGIAPIFFILVFYRVQRLPAFSRLGLTAANFFRAIPGAIAGSLFVIPFIYWVGILLVLLFHALGIEHPEKHKLLLLLEESPDWITQSLMLLAAVIVAPLFEEILFRAHLQTLLAHLGGRRRISYRADPPVDLILTPPYTPHTPHPLPYEARTSLYESRPGPAARWIAVITSSLLFAAVHEWWTAPAIFLLSLCFGYAYERTGNLWTPILMHFAFNATSILLSQFA